MYRRTPLARTPPTQQPGLFQLLVVEIIDLYEFLSILLEKTNVHGIKFVFNQKLHAIERLVWLALILAACYGAFSISSKQYERYVANPTVISLERDYRDWNGTLPAISVCYHRRVDASRAQIYIKRKWGIEEDDEQFPYFFDYVRSVVYVNESFIKFNKFVNDKRLEFVDMLEIAREVHPVINSVISSFDTSAEFSLSEIITEKGICYTVNSVLAPLISTT
jgi:hypothetical protein